MKQCPQCGSTYSDDTLNFCLTDRTSLVSVPETDGEDTVVRDYPVGETTRVASAGPGVSPLFKYLAIGLGVLLLLLAGAGLAAWSFWNSRSELSQQTSNAASPAVGSGAARAASNTGNAVNSANKDREVSETPSAVKTPVPSATQPPSEAAHKDAGTGRITFNRGSVSKTMSGTLVHDRTFVLRTMSGQSLSAKVTSKDGCVEFDAGGNSVSFATPNGDVSLNLTNTCDDPAPFNMTVTVR